MQLALYYIVENCVYLLLQSRSLMAYILKMVIQTLKKVTEVVWIMGALALDLLFQIKIQVD